MPINRSIPGQLRDEEMQAIELVASLVPPQGNIVEVGSLLGLSSWIWAKSAPPSVTVHCIDPWELAGKGGNFGRLAAGNSQTFTREQFLTNIKDCPNVHAHQGYSPDDFVNWKQPIDLYFEDAVHTDPIFSKNLEFWCGHLKPSGIVCGHDFHERFPDVCAGAERLAERLERRLRVIRSFWFLLPESVTKSGDARVQAAVAQLTRLEASHRPPPVRNSDKFRAVLAKANAIPSLAYEIDIEGTARPSKIDARLGDDIVLRGIVHNTSGHDWPVVLSLDCYLEVGAELHVLNKKVAAARQEITGSTVAAGETIKFELRLSTGIAGPGFCVVDVLYRYVRWFRDRAEALTIPVRIASRR